MFKLILFLVYHSSEPVIILQKYPFDCRHAFNRSIGDMKTKVHDLE